MLFCLGICFHGRTGDVWRHNSITLSSACRTWKGMKCLLEVRLMDNVHLQPPQTNNSPAKMKIIGDVFNGAWHDPGQNIPRSLLSHAGRHQLGKTPGPGVTIRTSPCAQHPAQCSRKSSWGHSWGAQPLPRGSQGILTAYFPSIWH